MSIATKKGDDGTTGMLYGQRVTKTSPPIEAVGSIDELNASIGLVRPLCWEHPAGKAAYATLKKIQRTLTHLMGEIVCDPGKRKDGHERFPNTTPEDLEILDQLILDLEKKPELKQNDWVLYGGSHIGSRFDFASKMCRKAERAVLYAHESGGAYRSIVLQYLNRLSDYLHLEARLFDFLDNLA